VHLIVGEISAQYRDAPMFETIKSSSRATHVTPSGSCTHAVRIQKISNKSSFGSNDNGDSAAIDRIIVIAETALLIDSGAWQCRSGLQMNAGYTTIPEY